MSNVNFDYKGNKIIIQCNPEDKLYKICTKFASKINQPVESKIYIYNNQLLNLEKTLSEQLKELNKENEEITIFVNDIAKNDTVLIKYNFNGVEEELQVKRGDNFLKIIRTLIKKPIDILFGGKAATENDFDKNFEQLANKYEKQKNQMNVLVLERSSSINSNEEEENKERKTIKKDDNEENLINQEEEEEKEDNNDFDDNNKMSKEKFIEVLMSGDQKRMQEYLKYLTGGKGLKIKNRKKFLFKFYICLFIKLILIDGLVFLGCYFKLNEELNKNTDNTLWAFIPSIILIHFLYFFYYCYLNFDRDNKKKSIYITALLFILVLSLLLILLSNYVYYHYIIFTLSLISLDALVYSIFYLIHYPERAIFPFLTSLLFKIGGLVSIYFYLLENKNISTIIIIGVISLYVNIIINSFRYISKEGYNDNQYVFMVLNFDLQFIAPIPLVFMMLFFFAFYILFLVILCVIFILVKIFGLLFC